MGYVRQEVTDWALLGLLFGQACQGLIDFLLFLEHPVRGDACLLDNHDQVDKFVDILLEIL